MRAAAMDGFWTDAYEYALPPELIAQHPPDRREQARLMLVERDRDAISHHSFAALPELLRAGDLMVANDSRVVPARLHARKESGGAVELLLLPPPAGNRMAALSKSSKPLRRGAGLTLADGARIVVADVPGGGRCLLDFGDRAPLEVLDALGSVPLPPYIRGGKEGAGDRERYQTVYARTPGSVAAPTAGLHFSATTLEALAGRGVEFATLTLHVGPGTFAPLRGSPETHEMDAETVQVAPALAARIENARGRGGRIVAVGTTSVRALESAADPSHPGRVTPMDRPTRLFIRPGHRFRVCDALVTNFHLPNSTLLCLVMAFAGEPLLRRAYEEAVRMRYRFYSYGDAMLVV